MTARTSLCVLLALLAFSCATPVREETVVVLPGPDGKSGTVVVQREGARQVLDAPYAANVVRGDGSLQGSRASEQQVAASFGATFAVTEITPWPPSRISARQVASSPE